MDITRNWRLKTSRSQLLATRCPTTGAVILPLSGPAQNHLHESYRFEIASAQPQIAVREPEYAKAAR